jgi:hypothetical protein
VQSPESAKGHPSLTGLYTVLQFLPPVTGNAQAIAQWNKTIAKFRDRPVQFVWIASENWSAVQPFLRERPMDGWLLIDEKNDAARAYGCCRRSATSRRFTSLCSGPSRGDSMFRR